MQEPQNITWRELTGNKFITKLHPAMLSDKGYVKTQLIRKIGDTVKSRFLVTYDSEYVKEYLTRELCKPLFSIGKEQIVDLIGKVWDSDFPNATNKAVTLPKNS